jgi:hypothetical protein
MDFVALGIFAALVLATFGLFHLCVKLGEKK